MLMRTGQQMIQWNHFKAKDIASKLESMKLLWESLVYAVREQVSRLGQAEGQDDYNKVTQGLRAKKGDIEGMLGNTDTEEDMRGCKRLVSQLLAAEGELAAVEAKVIN